jgi:hypothetical protein
VPAGETPCTARVDAVTHRNNGIQIEALIPIVSLSP